MRTTNLERVLVAEFVTKQPIDSVFTAGDYILYVFGALVNKVGMSERDAIVYIAKSEIKRRFRELRDPRFAETPFVIDTYREDPSLTGAELRLIQRGKLR